MDRLILPCQTADVDSLFWVSNSTCVMFRPSPPFPNSCGFAFPSPHTKQKGCADSSGRSAVKDWHMLWCSCPPPKGWRSQNNSLLGRPSCDAHVLSVESVWLLCYLCAASPTFSCLLTTGAVGTIRNPLPDPPCNPLSSTSFIVPTKA